MTTQRAKTASTTRTKTVPSGSSTQDDIQFAKLEAELRSKPGTWTILSIVLAAVALPAGLLGAWFSREVDALRRDFDEVTINASAASESSKLAAANAERVVAVIDELVVAIARDTAMPVEGAELIFVARTLIPADLLGQMKGDGTLQILRYSDFYNKDWIFVRSDEFNLLTSEAQETLKTSLATMEVNFFIE